MIKFWHALKTMVTLLNHFTVYTGGRGITLEHESGSRITFTNSGSIQLWAERNIFQDSANYIFQGSASGDEATDEICADELILDRIRMGQQEVLEHLLDANKRGKLLHLTERAHAAWQVRQMALSSQQKEVPHVHEPA